LTNSHRTLQFVKADRELRGEAVIAGTGRGKWLNYQARFCCRFAADAANVIRSSITGCGHGGTMADDRSQGIYWTGQDCGAS
jgi:hypothetical protein